MSNTVDRCGSNAAAEAARQQAIREAQQRAAAERAAEQRAAQAKERAAEQRKAASAEQQKAARAMHAHSVAKPADAKKPDDVATATKKIDDARKAIDNAKSDQAKRAATVNATKTIAQELANQSPADRAKTLQASQDNIQKIATAMGPLSGDDTKRAIGNLTAAAEACGPKDAHLVTDPVAKALPAVFKNNGANHDEVLAGIKDAMANGRGASFAVALNKSVQSPALTKALGDNFDNDVRTQFRDAVGDATKSFDSASKAATTDDARLALIAGQWAKSGALTPGALQAGADAFKKSKAADYNKAESAARTLASMMPGAAAMASDPGSTGDAAKAVLKEFPNLASTSAGASAIASALQNKSPWIETARQVNGADPSSRKAFDDAVMQSVATKGPMLAKDNDRQALSSLLLGAGDAVNDAKTKLALHEYNDRFKAFAKDVTGLALGRQLALTAKTVAGAVFGDKLSSTESSLGSAAFAGLGVAFGLGALAGDVEHFNPESARSIVTAGGHLGVTGLSVAQLLGKGAPEVLSKAGLGIGLALSAFNVGDDLVHGNVGGAAVASLPLEGAAIGAGIGVGFFGAGAVVGAGIGLAVGGLASAAISVFGGGGPRPDQIQETETDPFLKAAFAHDHIANSETAAYRLRDVYTDGNTFTGVGSGIAALAKQSGRTPREVLDQLAAMPSDQLRDRVTAILEAERNGVLPK
jgi:hypothetical protein